MSGKGGSGCFRLSYGWPKLTLVKQKKLFGDVKKGVSFTIFEIEIANLDTIYYGKKWFKFASSFSKIVEDNTSYFS